jgi:hypothetical protein
MSTQFAALLCIAFPPVLYALAKWRTPKPPLAFGSASYFHCRPTLRAAGFVVAFGALALLTLPVLLAMPDSAFQQNWSLVLSIGLLAGSSASVVGFVWWRAEIRLDDAGLCGVSLIGLPRFVEWAEVNSLTFCPGAEALRMNGGCKPVYVPVLLGEWPKFLAQFKQRLPDITLPEEVHADGGLLVDEAQLQRAYARAGQTFLIALFAVTSSFFFLPFNGQAVALSAIAGVGIALHPVIHRLQPDIIASGSAWVSFSQGAGLLMSIFCMMRAYNLQESAMGGRDAFGDSMYLLLMTHALGTAILVYAGILLICRTCWPERFSRKRMM